MPEVVQLEVIVDPKVTGLVEGAVCFETGLTRDQAADPELYAYEHHGDEFTPVDPGSLTCFFEDILLGRPMPTKFVASSLAVDVLFAITLFLHRDLATHPRLPGLIAALDLSHRRGIQGLAHIEGDLVEFLLLLTDYLNPEKPLSKKEEGNRLNTVVGWVSDFIQQRSGVPQGVPIPIPQIRDVGTNGFVVAELPRGTLALGWVDLYRKGYTRGVLIGPEDNGRRRVMASRKSVYVPFNTVKAASALNELEAALGPAHLKWLPQELWLYSPYAGSVIPVESMMEVFLRV